MEDGGSTNGMPLRDGEVMDMVSGLRLPPPAD